LRAFGDQECFETALLLSAAAEADNATPAPPFCSRFDL